MHKQIRHILLLTTILLGFLPAKANDIINNYLAKIDAEKQIRNAKLVIHDYISTSYIESLLLNIPTVLFFNKESSFLNDDHRDFFKPLIDCKICHTDPNDCADFINQIFSDPSDWWNSEIVQYAKNEFLKRNINKPEKMFNYLINISK